MTLAKRVIACLDVDAGRVVKGTKFQDLQVKGAPFELAKKYEREGADEIVFLDISATVEGRNTRLDMVSLVARSIFIPLTVGGGIRTLSDMEALLRAGADKVAINSAAIERPSLITEASQRFGAQSIVGSIDAAQVNGDWKVVTRSGSSPQNKQVIEWAQECVQLGVGELLVTSIERDGTRSGYGIELLSAIANAVSVPVIASGGAGSPKDLVDVFNRTPVEAALVAGILHDNQISLSQIKAALAANGITVRPATLQTEVVK